MTNASDGGFLRFEVPWLGYATGILAVSLNGDAGIVAASRSSDCTNLARNLPIAVAGVGVCDNGTPAWPGYFEVRLKPTGNAYCQFEIEAINEKGTNTNHVNPYNVLNTVGVTCLGLGSGGSINTSSNPDKTQTYPADNPIIILNNGQSFRYGITFQATSLAGCDGINGTAEVLQFAKGHQLQWYSQAGKQLSITSQATDPAAAIDIIAVDWGLNVQSGGWAVANFFPTYMLQPTGTSLALLLKTESGNLELKQVMVGPVDETGHRVLRVPA